MPVSVINTLRDDSVINGVIYNDDSIYGYEVPIKLLAIQGLGKFSIIESYGHRGRMTKGKVSAFPF